MSLDELLAGKPEPLEGFGARLCLGLAVSTAVSGLLSVLLFFFIL